MVKHRPVLRLSWLVATHLAGLVTACDVCDGISGRKVASGQVLEISDEGLHRLTPSHDVLALLLYKSWDAKTERMQTAFDKAALALHRSNQPIVLAQLDVDAFPTVSMALRVAAAEIPTIRILRSDTRFAYPLRVGANAGEIEARLRQQLERDARSVVRRLDAEALDALSNASAPGTGTRVVGELRQVESLRAFEQVAHAYHGIISFFLPASAPPSSALQLAPPPSSSPSLPPRSSSPLPAALVPASRRRTCRAPPNQ